MRSSATVRRQGDLRVCHHLSQPLPSVVLCAAAEPAVSPGRSMSTVAMDERVFAEYFAPPLTPFVWAVGGLTVAPTDAPSFATARSSPPPPLPGRSSGPLTNGGAVSSSMRW